MRFPLAAALGELAAHGVHVTLSEGYRAPQRQEAMVKSSTSTAPPGWSLHGYGLAVDLAPAGRCNDGCFNPKSAQWKTIIATMQKYGFSSLFRDQGWDLPHFELPVKTAQLVKWPHDDHGHKVIPPENLPPTWKRINAAALGR